jgi:hypothetical protein
MMKNILVDLRMPAIVSTLLLLPFLILELVNQPGSCQAFPIPLFAALWLLPVTILLALASSTHTLRSGEKIKEHLPGLLFQAAIFLLAAGLWIAILLDQMPCFLGARNCD